MHGGPVVKQQGHWKNWIFFMSGLVSPSQCPTFCCPRQQPETSILVRKFTISHLNHITNVYNFTLKIWSGCAVFKKKNLLIYSFIISKYNPEQENKFLKLLRKKNSKFFCRFLGIFGYLNLFQSLRLPFWVKFFFFNKKNVDLKSEFRSKNINSTQIIYISPIQEKKN